MKRRDFLAAAGSSLIDADQDSPSRKPEISEFANKVLPKVARTTAGLEPYTGSWGMAEVSHLLRRTLFGLRRSDVQALLPGTMNGAVDALLLDQPLPDPPLNVNVQDTGVPVGQTWVNASYTDPNNTKYNPDGSRAQSLKAWWIGLMVNSPVSLREKMVLFWHNHFVSAYGDVSDARFMYKQHLLFRQYALGNFKELAKQITIDPGMLRYLNGNSNTNTNPNENYGRELQELFTIGKGPEIAPGNYTNYTEDDVKAAARVLTGWRDSRTAIGSYFTPSRHDATDKQFSANYGSHIITGRTDVDGANEANDLIEMIFAQPETARFICRKFYRWFVYYLIDDVTEQNVIAPMADALRANNYDVKPVLSLLFRSAHFYDPVNRGCLIKSPVDLTVGMMREFAVRFPDATSLATQYGMWLYIQGRAAAMQQNICDPPNVAGWSAYYQEPEYYEAWINSDTLQRRNQFTDRFISSTGYQLSGTSLVIDPIAFTSAVSDPSDPNILINETSQLLFAIPLTDTQKAFLKDTLIPGLPDYEWTTEWLDYKNDPTNPMKLSAVSTKLQALYKFMMDMAEYQLS